MSLDRLIQGGRNTNKTTEPKVKYPVAIAYEHWKEWLKYFGIPETVSDRQAGRILQGYAIAAVKAGLMPADKFTD